jgi:hypothetical protein
MLRFALKVLLFIAPLALPTAYAELRLRHVTTSYMQKRDALARPRPGDTVIVTGSSHEYMGIKPSSLGMPGYNLANVSQSLLLDEKMVEMYLDRFPDVRFALVGLSYFSFESTLSTSPEAWRLYHYERFFGIDGELDPLPRIDTRRLSLVALYGPSRTIQLAKQGFPPRLDEVDAFGWLPLNLQLTERSMELGRVRVQQHHAIMEPKNAVATRAALDRMLALLQSKGITSILVSSPVTPEYLANCQPERLALAEHAANEMSRKYGLRFANYMADPRFAGEDFADFDHLSPAGAEKFSRLLATEVLGTRAAP